MIDDDEVYDKICDCDYSFPSPYWDDISDNANPKPIGHWNPHPPYPGFAHTAMPLLGRDLIIVTDECIRPAGEDWPKLTWVLDARDETNLVPISTLPLPPLEDYAGRGGRFEFLVEPYSQQYMVRVVPPEGIDVVKMVSVPARDDLVVRLPGTGVLKGKVVDAGTQQPVAGANERP